MREGDVISINGTTGEIVVGAGAGGHARADRSVRRRSSAGPTSFRALRVRTNADLPDDAEVAREFGAEGIGLCRTEHMFLGDRLPLVQRFILADSPAEEEDALAELEKLQRSDFVGILEAMDGLPVTIRLLDPPLHEFLPDLEELIVKRGEGRARRRGPSGCSRRRSSGARPTRCSARAGAGSAS